MAVLTLPPRQPVLRGKSARAIEEFHKFGIYRRNTEGGSLMAAYPDGRYRIVRTGNVNIRCLHPRFAG